VASDREFATFVCEQLRGAGEISSRRMFGEAAIYLQDKVAGLVCDNQQEDRTSGVDVGEKLVPLA
jgi:DNA transformation protein and related proteins